ncbi:uncharacterized protein LOC134234587 [Saccostrea cucullata]|uniref:uncharacterized protein LOC134234587 n=1 Tax=Saccostrea cuccullata TaxID=36930 RepID=UPI002ED1B2FA
MTKHFQQHHPGQKVCYKIHTRKEQRDASSPSFPYKTRKISKYPSPKKSTTQSHSSKAEKPASKDKAEIREISPLRSPSVSISLHGSPPLVNLYGLDDPDVSFEPPRKVVRCSPPVSQPPPVSKLPLVAVSQLPPVAVNQLPPVAVSQLPPVAVSQLPPVAVSQLPPVAVSQLPPVAVSQLPPVDIPPPVSQLLSVSHQPYPESAVFPGKSDAAATIAPTTTQTGVPPESFNLPDELVLDPAAAPTTAMSPTSSFIASLGAEFPLISPLKESVLVSDVPSEPPTSSASVETCPPASDYILHTCQGSDLKKSSLDLSHDPRLFFAGAPSGLNNTYVDNMLSRANREARRSAGRMTMEASTQTDDSNIRPPTPRKCDASTQVTARQTFTLE